MAKPEWGLKRNCLSCGVRFYDLKRDPIICPNCNTEFDPLALVRPRRTRMAAKTKKEVKSEKKIKFSIEEKIGNLIAKRSIEKGVKKVVFDKGSYAYHGKVKALAESARKSGLDF